MTESKSLARQQADLDIRLARLVDERLPEAVVRTALNSVFAGAPIEEIATALVICKQYGLSPVAGHVAVFKPASGEKWVYQFSLDAWLTLAQRNPAFQGITFGDPKQNLPPFIEVDDEIHYYAYAWRRGFDIPSGPFIGRCKRQGKRKDGSTWKIEWSEEIARARAVRHACRTAFGVTLPRAPGEEYEVVGGHVIDIEEAEPEALPATPTPSGESEQAPSQERPGKAPRTEPSSPASSGGEGPSQMKGGSSDAMSDPGRRESGSGRPSLPEETQEQGAGRFPPPAPAPPQPELEPDQPPAARDVELPPAGPGEEEARLRVELIERIEALADNIFKTAKSRKGGLERAFAAHEAVYGDYTTVSTDALERVAADLEGMA